MSRGRRGFHTKARLKLGFIKTFWKILQLENNEVSGLQFVQKPLSFQRFKSEKNL